MSQVILKSVTGRVTEGRDDPIAVETDSDVLFLLPIESRNNNRYSQGLLYVSAYLREKGYDNTVFDYPESIYHEDYTEEMALEACKAIVTKLKPKIIFFTAHTTEAYGSVRLLKDLRSICDFKALIGGYHASSRPEDFVDNGFDYILIGEAERTSHWLVDAIAKGHSVSEIPGLMWKEGGEIRHNTEKDRIKDLNTLPFPAYDKVNMEKYIRMDDGIIRGIPLRAANVTASRGCGFRCSFCASPELNGRTVRWRSPDNVEEEIRMMHKKYGVEAIWFTDDTLTSSRIHVKRICKVMKELGMFWGAQARVDCLNEEMILMMKDAGCLQLDFGIESGSKRVLEEIMLKGFYPDQIRKSIALCNKHGMRTLANFIIGLPTETEEELQETIDLAKEIQSSFYRLNLAIPLPGTALYDIVGEDVTIEEYGTLNFSADSGSNRLNKSFIPDIHKKYQELNRKMLIWTLKNSFKSLDIYFKVWWTLGRKKERAAHVMRHIMVFLIRNFTSLGSKVRWTRGTEHRKKREPVTASVA